MKCLKCGFKLQEATVYLSNNDLGLTVSVPSICPNCTNVNFLSVRIVRQKCLGAVREEMEKL